MEGELPMGVVNEMSLAWRNMCKTVYDLKKQDMYPPDLKELKVDSSPETSTKAAPHSAASGAPSVGSHETVASMPVDEKPVAENTVAAELNQGQNKFCSEDLWDQRQLQHFQLSPFQM